uniref:Uncharacterized protein n=1 Tax=Romanomermis culicivorax TaxID=13658 RepID=A0A915HN37_ROMCU
MRDKLGLNGGLKDSPPPYDERKKLMDLLEYIDCLDEVVNEDWEEDQDYRPSTRKDPFQMSGSN